MSNESTAHPHDDRPSVMLVYGTRPEAIKTAPLVTGLRDRGKVRVVTTVTGQHRQMLDQVNEVFGITPEHDLELFDPGQGIESIVAKTLTRLTPVLHAEKPDAVVVHGDTSTANAAAQAAFYAGVPVVHLEAGLRTYNLASPFPEEANRQIITRLAALHLAPTDRNREALLDEHVDPASIAVTRDWISGSMSCSRAQGSSQTSAASSASASQACAGMSMESRPSRSPRIRKPVTFSRPSSLSTLVLKQPLRT